MDPTWRMPGANPMIFETLSSSASASARWAGSKVCCKSSARLWVFMVMAFYVEKSWKWSNTFKYALSFVNMRLGGSTCPRFKLSRLPSNKKEFTLNLLHASPTITSNEHEKADWDTKKNPEKNKCFPKGKTEKSEATFEIRKEFLSEITYSHSTLDNNYCFMNQ